METGQLVAERFVVERLVARGGMGRVYRAHDTLTGARVALKILHDDEPALRKRLAVEARALIELRHPTIVRYVAHGREEAGALYLAMEWIDGVSLAQRLDEQPLDVDESLALVARIADGLGAAHQRGVVHRDIKPSNLLLVGGHADDVKIVDFGIARLSRWQDLTATGAGLGTPAYMAPEQVRRGRHVDARADVFSLGCVLFRCLTGQSAFRAQHVAAVLAQIAILEEAPRVRDLRPELPEALDALVAELLALDPARRPADGAVVHDRVAALRMQRQARQDEAGAPAPALTRRELQPVSIVVVRRLATRAPAGEHTGERKPNELLATVPIGRSQAALLDETTETRTVAQPAHQAPASLVEIRNAMRPFGARVELLLDGTVVALFTGGDAATDLAVRAARSALAARALGNVAIGVATQRAIVHQRGAITPLIDDAASLAQRADGPGIRIDEGTRLLLPAELRVEEHAGELRLVGEDAPPGPAEVSPRGPGGQATRCIGRSRILAQLHAAFEGSIEDDAAAAVVVVGGAGLGKSRVRAALAGELRRDHPEATILYAAGDPLRSQVPNALIARALAHGLGLSDADDAGAALDRALTTLVELPADERDRVRSFVGALCGVENLDATPALRASRHNPRLAAEQTRRAWEDVVCGLCRRGPVALLLDDLHWADLSSVELIAHALRRARELPLTVIAFGREELRERFPQLADDWHRQEIVLSPLSGAAARTLARELAGDLREALDDPTLEELVGRAAGNPFYLEELVRAHRRGDGTTLPDSVVASVQMRIARIPEGARQVLRAASIFGPTFWPAGVAHLLGPEQARDLDRWLDVLLGDGLVVAGADGTPLSLGHDLIRDAAYRMLPDGDRAVGHRLAGEWLEARGGTDPVVLAEHFAGGRVADRALGWFERAADEALQESGVEGTARPPREALIAAATYYHRGAEAARAAHANRTGVELADRAAALAAPLQAALAARAHRLAAELSERLGDRRGALARIAAAEACTPAGEETLRVALSLDRAALELRDRDGGPARARRTAEDALAMARALGDAGLEAEALTMLAVVLIHLGGEEDRAIAVNHSEAALRLFRSRDGNLARPIWRLANAFLEHGQLDRADELYHEALGRAREAGDEELVAACWGNMSSTAYLRWQLDAAVSQTERSLGIYRRIGHVMRIAETTYNLGLFQLKRGNVEAAEPLLRSGLTQGAREWNTVVHCRQSLAELARFRGREDEAQRLARAAVDTCREVGAGELLAVQLGLLASSLWATGAWAEALARLREALQASPAVTMAHASVLVRMGALDEASEWLARFEGGTDEPDGQAAAKLALARIRWRAGDPEKARRSCREALAILSGTDAPCWLVPAQTLDACVLGDVDGALDGLARARQVCGHDTIGDVAVDVGAALVEGLERPGDGGARAKRYLGLIDGIADRGVRYRILDLCAAVLAGTGDRLGAARYRRGAASELAALRRRLPEAERDWLGEHPWVRALDAPLTRER